MIELHACAHTFDHGMQYTHETSYLAGAAYGRQLLELHMVTGIPRHLLVSYVVHVYSQLQVY